MIFSPFLLKTIFKKFIVSLIHWGEASYDQSITTAALLKHKNIKYIHVIFNNINTIMHTGLQSFFIYHLTFVWDMPFVLVISYISVTQSFISLRILRMSNFMLQVAVSSLHIYFFTRSPWLDCVRIVWFCFFLFINFFKIKFQTRIGTWKSTLGFFDWFFFTGRWSFFMLKFLWTHLNHADFIWHFLLL